MSGRTKSLRGKYLVEEMNKEAALKIINGV